MLERITFLFNSSKLALPYICRLMFFNRFIFPSTIPPMYQRSMVLRINGGVVGHKYFGILTVDEMLKLREDNRFNTIDEITILEDKTPLDANDNFFIQISY